MVRTDTVANGNIIIGFARINWQNQSGPGPGCGCVAGGSKEISITTPGATPARLKTGPALGLWL